jgi:hypothetical protein
MKYINEKGEHIAATKERFFQGNLIFASKHCFNLLAHSRRDDLISLSYLLLYLVDGDLAFLTKEGDSEADNADDKQFNHAEFQRIKALKNKMTPKALCESPEALTFLPFLEEVFSYEFDQAPDYGKLRNMLLKCLKTEGKSYDNIYDWNEEYEMSKPQQAPQLRLNLQKAEDAEVEMFDDMCDKSPMHAGGYQFIANENHAVMKKAQVAPNQEDSHMNHSFDKELVSFSNPQGTTKGHSPPEFQRGSNAGLNQVSSPTTIRHN